jgi:phage gpG-like protein
MGLNFQFGLHWEYGRKRGSFSLFHREFVEKIGNWKPAFAEIAGDVLEPYVIGGFQSEGKSEGVTWKELARSTIKARGSAHPILQVSGHLMESFQKGGRDHREEIKPRKLVWGSDVPYALFHEFGTGGKVNFKAAGARKVIARTKEAAKRLADSQAAEGGLVPRPMFVYNRFLANEITSKMLGYGALIARQVGFGVTSSRGLKGILPEEARSIGQKLLQIRSEGLVG